MLSKSFASNSNGPSGGSRKSTWMVVAFIVLGALLIGGGSYALVKSKASNASKASGASVASPPTPVPVDGRWSDWGECKEVSKGVWKSYRTCVSEATNGGKPCSKMDGGNSERTCIAVNGQWKDQENFETLTCYPMLVFGDPVLENGRVPHFKNLECIPPKYGGAPCPTLPAEYKAKIDGNFAFIPCAATDGKYGDWGACANDRQQRVCSLPVNGGLPCSQDYPQNVPNGLVGFSFRTSTIYMGSTGMYTASCAFDYSPNTYWRSELQYNAATGVYTGSSSTTVRNSSWEIGLFSSLPSWVANQVKGEWIQVNLPYDAWAQNYQLLGFRIAPGAASRVPRLFTVLSAQNPNSTEWDIEHATILPVNDWQPDEFRTFYINNKPRKRVNPCYRLVVNEVGNANQTTLMDSVEIRQFTVICGTQEPLQTRSCQVGAPEVRFVRVQVTDGSDVAINLNEIEVYDENNQKIAISANQVSSSGDLSGYPRTNAVNNQTYDSPMAHTLASTATVPSFFEIDFGSNKKVKEVRIYNRDHPGNKCCYERLFSCSLILKHDTTQEVYKSPISMLNLATGLTTDQANRLQRFDFQIAGFAKAISLVSIS